MKRLLAFLCAAVLCTGCLDVRSLDRYGYVLGIGFDAGEKLPYCVTLMIEKTSTDSDNQTSGGFTVVSAECRGLSEAEEVLSANLPYRLNFARAELIVIASELLLREGALSDALGFPIAHLKLRHNACVFAANGSARDVMAGLDNRLNPNLSRVIRNYVAYSETTGLIPVTSVMTVEEATRTRRFDLTLPILGTKDDNAGLSGGADAYFGGEMPSDGGMDTGAAGAAVLRNDCMVTRLSGQETQLLLMATGRFREGTLALTDADGETVLLYLMSDGAVKTELNLAGTPYVRVTIPIAASAALRDRLTEAEKRELAAKLTETLTEGTDRVFRTTQALGADTFGLRRHAAKQFTDEEHFDAYPWDETLKRLDAAFVYRVRIDEKTASEEGSGRNG